MADVSGSFGRIQRLPHDSQSAASAVSPHAAKARSSSVTATAPVKHSSSAQSILHSFNRARQHESLRPKDHRSIPLDTDYCAGNTAKLPAMKPVVSAGHAWSWYVAQKLCSLLSAKGSTASEHIPQRLTLPCIYSTVVSVFAIVILSALAIVYRSGHEEFVGGNEDPTPEEGVAISGTILTAVFVYLVRLASQPVIGRKRLLFFSNASPAGLLHLLRLPRHAPRTREPTRQHCPINKAWRWRRHDGQTCVLRRHFRGHKQTALLEHSSFMVFGDVSWGWSGAAALTHALRHGRKRRRS